MSANGQMVHLGSCGNRPDHHTQRLPQTGPRLEHLFPGHCGRPGARAGATVDAALVGLLTGSTASRPIAAMPPPLSRGPHGASRSGISTVPATQSFWDGLLSSHKPAARGGRAPLSIGPVLSINRARPKGSPQFERLGMPFARKRQGLVVVSLAADRSASAWVIRRSPLIRRRSKLQTTSLRSVSSGVATRVGSRC
jgi:hypothetical protein